MGGLVKRLRLVGFLAFRQLWDRKLLNGIAVAGVALGVLVLIAMNGIMQGFQVRFKTEILKISPHVQLFAKEVEDRGPLLAHWTPGPQVAGVRHELPAERTTRIKRPWDLVSELERMPEVVAACGNLRGQAIVSVGAKDLAVDMRGVLPMQQERCTPVSRFVVAGDWRTLPGRAVGVALGVGVADTLGVHVGDRLRIVAPGGRPMDLEVVAIYDSGIPSVDKTRIYVNLTLAQAVLRKPDVVGQLELRLRDPGAAFGVAARIERMTGYDAESWQETQANFLSLFDMQNMIVNFVIGAILVVGGFGILAVQIMIVLSKTRDIAILRSIGLRRGDILATFLLQGLVIALIGAGVGDLLGWRLVNFLSTLEVKSEGLVKSSTFQIHKDSMYYLYGVLFALLTGGVASLLPALRGSRVEPVDVLRGQVG